MLFSVKQLFLLLKILLKIIVPTKNKRSLNYRIGALFIKSKAKRRKINIRTAFKKATVAERKNLLLQNFETFYNNANKQYNESLTVRVVLLIFELLLRF